MYSQAVEAKYVGVSRPCNWTKESIIRDKHSYNLFKIGEKHPSINI